MDGEALDMLLATEHAPAVKERLLAAARAALLASVDWRNDLIHEYELVA